MHGEMILSNNTAVLGSVPIGASATWADLLDPEMKEFVPKHWLQFRPPSPQAQYTLGALYIIIMTVGVLGNVCIIWLFCTSKALRTPSNYLVINLALSDFLILIKMPVFIYNSFTLGPTAGIYWCRFYGLLGGVSGTSAIMTIAAMSLERYISISKPLNPSSRMTRSRASLMIIAIWIYSIIFSFSPLFGLNRYVPEGYLTSCSFDYLSDDLSSRIFVLVFFVAAWCIPMLIVSLCYLGIVCSVRQNQRVFYKHAMRMQTSDRNLEKQKQTEVKLAKIAFSLISIWTASWTPYATVALLGLFSDRSMLTPLTSMIPALFCKTASVLDPFIYGLSNWKFKVEINKVIGKIFPSNKTADKSHSFVLRTMSIGTRNSVSSEEMDEREQEECVSLDDDEDAGCSSSDFLCNCKEGTNTCTEISETSYEEKGKHVSSTGDVEHDTDQVAIKSIKIFFIPQTYAVQMKQDEIKLKFRRSF